MELGRCVYAGVGSTVGRLGLQGICAKSAAADSMPQAPKIERNSVGAHLPR